MPRNAAIIPITAKQLRTVLIYNPKTGVFIWQKRDDHPQKWNSRYAGKPAGWVDLGYIRITIDYRTYPAHHLAYLFMTGRWPENVVDHRNGIRLDNRWKNLRAATRSQNSQNAGAHKDSFSSLKGAHWHPGAGRWMASIMIAGKSHYLGLFATPELAHAAYCEAATRLHGEFARFE